MNSSLTNELARKSLTELRDRDEQSRLASDRSNLPYRSSRIIESSSGTNLAGSRQIDQSLKELREKEREEQLKAEILKAEQAAASANKSARITETYHTHSIGSTSQQNNIKQQFISNPSNITPVNFTATQGVSRQIFQGDSFTSIQTQPLMLNIQVVALEEVEKFWKAKYLEMEEQLLIKTEKLHNVEHRFAEYESRIQGLLGDNQNFYKMKTDYERTVGELTGRHTLLSQKLQDYENKIALLSTEIERLTNQNRNLIDDYNNLKQNFIIQENQTAENHNMQINGHKRQIQSLQDDINQLRQQTSSSSSTIEQYQSQISNLQYQLGQVTSQYRGAADEIAGLKSKIYQLESYQSSLIEQMETTKKEEVEYYVKDLQIWKEKFIELNHKYHYSQEENNMLKAELEQIKLKYAHQHDQSTKHVISSTVVRRESSVKSSQSSSGNNYYGTGIDSTNQNQIKH